MSTRGQLLTLLARHAGTIVGRLCQTLEGDPARPRSLLSGLGVGYRLRAL